MVPVMQRGEDQRFPNKHYSGLAKGYNFITSAWCQAEDELRRMRKTSLADH